MKFRPGYLDAVNSLRPTFNWSMTPEGGITSTDLGFVEPSKEEITSEMLRLQAEYDNAEYQRLRAAEYPSIQDQLDMQYHDALNGTTTWQTAVNAVKDKYPKPEGM